jgi:hypothetical protein
VIQRGVLNRLTWALVALTVVIAVLTACLLVIELT